MGKRARLAAPPLQGRGWGGDHPRVLNLLGRALPRPPHSNPAPEGEGRHLSGWAVLVALALAACATQRPMPASAPRPAPRPLVPGPVVRTPVPAPTPQKPTWTARKVVADAVDVPASTVTVANGDSLSAIAARTGVGVGALAAANGLAPAYTLIPGKVLQVPAGRYHRVKTGETGIAIARAYGVAWDTIITANSLSAPYNLRVGERLLLPSKRAVADMTLEQRARAFKLDIDDLITGSEPAARKPAAARPVRTAKASASPPVPKPSEPIAEPAAFSGRFTWPLTGRIVSAFGAKPGGAV